ncbi:hypothetical protein CGI13_13980 [Vibrio parahaemolyticus]|nr:hypothetical protein CGK29_20570 [Vibrio parahaemolyticus]TOI76835.1 hypothetical protein CGI54_21770 [Vibrio parahaemolyticus]TOK77031.1 hypothetical protein CGI13_13980 [Vibrio parahaemolyticus]
MNLESPSLLLVGKPEGSDFRHYLSIILFHNLWLHEWNRHKKTLPIWQGFQSLKKFVTLR